MPWETGATEGKYRYYPGGDARAEPKDAPSAVNVVVVPDVNLPKVRTEIQPYDIKLAMASCKSIGSCGNEEYIANIPQSLHDKYNKWGKDGY